MPIIWIALPFILAFACYGEIRERRIPNWLTLGAIALDEWTTFRLAGDNIAALARS